MKLLAIDYELVILRMCRFDKNIRNVEITVLEFEGRLGNC